jgi:hypothetical protein
MLNEVYTTNDWSSRRHQNKNAAYNKLSIITKETNTRSVHQDVKKKTVPMNELYKLMENK